MLQQQKVLELGNLDSKRDWGHAKDYVEVMYNGHQNFHIDVLRINFSTKGQVFDSKKYL